MPLVIADARALPVLFKTMSGARLALGVAMVIALLAPFVLMLRLRWQSLVPLALAALYVMVLPVSAIVLAPVFDRMMPIGASGHAMFNGEEVSVGQGRPPSPSCSHAAPRSTLW